MIEVGELKKRYGRVEALKGVDLRVEAGEIFSLLGPNGAGKTTLLRILTTLLRPDSGTVRVAGFDAGAQAAEVRRRIGVTFQEHALDPNLTGREVLWDSAGLYGLDRRRAEQRLQDLAPLMDMDEALVRAVKTYSGGMKRRLELARALLAEPVVLFLDEPTLGLDPQNRPALWDHLEDLRRRTGLTVFFTTHYMEEAERMADRVAIIDHGRILAMGSPGELSAALGGDVILLKGEGDAAVTAGGLRAAPFCREVEEGAGYLRVAVEDGGRSLADVVSLAAGAGFRLTDVQVRRPDLNEVFLRHTGRELRDR